MLLDAGSGRHLGGSGQAIGLGHVPSRLRYAPPSQSNPTVVQLGTGVHEQAYGADEDVLFVWPGTPRAGILNVSGGRHMRIIGGAGVGEGARVRFRENHGSVFIQGLDLDMGGVNSDSFNCHGVRPQLGPETYPDIYIQDCRVVGLTGTFETQHADFFQLNGPCGSLYFDRITAESDYQGFFIDPTWGITSAHFSRVNIRESSAGMGPAYTFASVPPLAAEVYPVALDLVFAEVTQPGRSLAVNRVRPNRDDVLDDGTPVGAIYDPATGSVSWPPASGVTGRVSAGVPIGGDFVPVGAVGAGYVNPGYRP